MGGGVAVGTLFPLQGVSFPDRVFVLSITLKQQVHGFTCGVLISSQRRTTSISYKFKCQNPMKILNKHCIDNIKR